MIKMTSWGEMLDFAECFALLSSRAQNILAIHQIKTPEQLAALSEQEVRKFRNCGRKVVKELRAFLGDKGLDLTDPIDSKVKRLEKEVWALKRALAEANRRIKELER